MGHKYIRKKKGHNFNKNVQYHGMETKTRLGTDNILLKPIYSLHHYLTDLRTYLFLRKSNLKEVFPASIYDIIKSNNTLLTKKNDITIICEVAQEKIHGIHSQHFEDVTSSYEFTVYCGDYLH